MVTYHWSLHTTHSTSHLILQSMIVWITLASNFFRLPSSILHRSSLHFFVFDRGRYWTTSTLLHCVRDCPVFFFGGGWFCRKLSDFTEKVVDFWWKTVDGFKGSFRLDGWYTGILKSYTMKNNYNQARFSWTFGVPNFDLVNGLPDWKGCHGHH